MAKSEVKAKFGKDGGHVVVQYDFGGDLDGAVKKYGGEIVYAYFKANGVVCLQDVIRSGIKAEKSQKEIQALASAWTPGIKRRGRSKSEKMREDFQKLSDDERAELLASLTS